MKLNLFSIPVYIDNIDTSKINIINKNFDLTWCSGTESSHKFQNEITPESGKYLAQKIYNLISPDIQGNFKLGLMNIWENRYNKNDYQEKHNHSHCHFSFIIYKKVQESSTVFESPAYQLIESFYPLKLLEKMNIFKAQFKPSCQKNQIIVFPSFLTHFVLKNSNSVTIAGNVKIEMET